MDDPVVVGGDLYVVENLIVSNEISDVMILACVDGDLHVDADVEFLVADVDSIVTNVDEVFVMKHYV